MLLSLGEAERERERENQEGVVSPSIMAHCYSKVEHSQYFTILFANIK